MTPHTGGAVVVPFDGGSPFRIKLPSPDVIAEGASAALLRGKMHASSSRTVDVALKVFRLPLNTEQRNLYRSLYRKELEVAERLGASKRYILPYLGTSILGYQPVIVSLYMPNGNLLDSFQSHDGNRQPMLLQVAEALSFLHNTAGIVHGDLKCENVLVSETGAPLLADFGLSAIVDKAAEIGTTDAGVRVWNTVRFAAPELLSDSAESESGRIRSKTTQSDVWAFGMLLVQAFTGKHPWPGNNNGVVAMQILTSIQHPRPAGDDVVWRGLTDEWWEVCVKCWEIEPSKRPGIQEVFDRLQAATRPRCFGISLQEQMVGSDVIAPPVLSRLCASIEKHGMNSTRIYRHGGAAQKAVRLQAQLDLDRAVELDSPEWTTDVDVVADVLVAWLRELPKPIINSYRASELAAASDLQSDELRRERASFIVPRFSKEKRATLKCLLGHLHRISDNHTVNLLSVEKLAVLFAPLLMHIPASHTVLDSGDFVALPTTSDTHRKIRGLEILLTFYTEIFEKRPTPTVISWSGFEWNVSSSAEGDYRRPAYIDVSSGSDEGTSESSSDSD